MFSREIGVGIKLGEPSWLGCWRGPHQANGAHCMDCSSCLHRLQLKCLPLASTSCSVPGQLEVRPNASASGYPAAFLSVRDAEQGVVSEHSSGASQLARGQHSRHSRVCSCCAGVARSMHGASHHAMRRLECCPIGCSTWAPNSTAAHVPTACMRLPLLSAQNAVGNWWNTNRQSVPRAATMYLSGKPNVKWVVSRCSLQKERNTLAWGNVVW